AVLPDFSLVRILNLQLCNVKLHLLLSQRCRVWLGRHSGGPDGHQRCVQESVVRRTRLRSDHPVSLQQAIHFVLYRSIGLQRKEAACERLYHRGNENSAKPVEVKVIQLGSNVTSRIEPPSVRRRSAMTLVAEKADQRFAQRLQLCDCNRSCRSRRGDRSCPDRGFDVVQQLPVVPPRVDPQQAQDQKDRPYRPKGKMAIRLLARIDSRSRVPGPILQDDVVKNFGEKRPLGDRSFRRSRTRGRHRLRLRLRAKKYGCLRAALDHGEVCHAVLGAYGSGSRNISLPGKVKATQSRALLQRTRTKRIQEKLHELAA